MTIYTLKSRHVAIKVILLLVSLMGAANAAAQTGPVNAAPNPASNAVSNTTATTPAGAAQTNSAAQPGSTSTAATPAQPETTVAQDATQPAASTAAVDDHLPFMSSPEAKPESEGPSSLGLLVRTMGALLLIVGLIVAAGWGLRKFGGTRFGAVQAGGPELSVLSTVTLGNNRSLAVVRFGTRTLLIGSTPQSINLLTTEPESSSQALPSRSVADLLDQPVEAEFDAELAGADERALDQSGHWTEQERSW